LKDVSKRMRFEWDKRARENARRYIALFNWQSEDAFDSSGKRVTEFLIQGLRRSDMKDMTVLDIGCGIGRVEKFLSPLFKEVYGVDVSQEMIKRGRKRVRNCYNVRLLECDGKDLRMFQDNKFNLVVSYNTFQSIPGNVVWSYCREAYRVLKPSGIFKFQVFEKTPFFKNPIGHLIDAAHAMRSRDVLNAIRGMLPVSDSNNFWVIGEWPEGKHYSRKEIKKKLGVIGFVNVKFCENLLEGKFPMLWVICRKPSRE